MKPTPIEEIHHDLASLRLKLKRRMLAAGRRQSHVERYYWKRAAEDLRSAVSNIDYADGAAKELKGAQQP